MAGSVAKSSTRTQPDLRGAELGLDDGGEAEVRRRGVQLVERADARRPRRRQPEARRQLARAQLAAGRVDRLDGVAGQPQRAGDPRRDRARCPPRT